MKTQGGSVGLTVDMPSIDCKYSIFDGAVVQQKNQSFAKVFTTESDVAHVDGLLPWLTYIIKVYAWCGTKMMYFEQECFTGAGGMIY